MNSNAQNSVDVVVGAQIREVRRRGGVELPELAKRLGVTVEAITAWEAGEIRPEPQQILALADALAVKPAVFFLPLRDAFPPDANPEETFRTMLLDAEKREYLKRSA